MNNKHKVSKTFLSILSGILAVLTLFFFVQIIIKANTPLMITISSKSDNIDYSDTDDNNDDYNEYDEEDVDIDDSDNSEEDEDIDDSDDDSDYEAETEEDEEGRIHKEKVFEAYYSYLSDWYDYFTDNDATAEVAFFDINDDGTNEMIVSFGTSLADWTNVVYYLNGYNVEEAGEIGSQQSFYEAEDVDGLYLVRGIQGMEIITQLTMDDENKIQTEEISNRHIDADEEYYSNDYPLEFHDLDSYLGY